MVVNPNFVWFLTIVLHDVSGACRCDVREQSRYMVTGTRVHLGAPLLGAVVGLLAGISPALARLTLGTRRNPSSLRGRTSGTCRCSAELLCGDHPEREEGCCCGTE